MNNRKYRNSGKSKLSLYDTVSNKSKKRRISRYLGLFNVLETTIHVREIKVIPNWNNDGLSRKEGLYVKVIEKRISVKGFSIIILNLRRIESIRKGNGKAERIIACIRRF